ncbi:hypothetical protein C5688_06490 [Methylocystis sp. MitZ-2018]|nr:hypothetical protein C5688_06490 [Methylocystis sp. MitZ-2018]
MSVSESLNFFARSSLWDAITDPGLDPTTFNLGDKTLTLPILVISTKSARSHERASLQVCDLIAGFISRVSASEQSEAFREFAQEVVAAGIGEASIFRSTSGMSSAKGRQSPPPGPISLIKLRWRWRAAVIGKEIRLQTLPHRASQHRNIDPAVSRSRFSAPMSSRKPLVSRFAGPPNPSVRGEQ